MITAYIDGACASGSGAWAFIVVEDGMEAFHDSGAEQDTTNNRMEIRSAIEALTATAGDIHVVSDSQYVVKGITEWVPKWRSNGWITSDKTDVLNRDLWEQLYGLCRGRDVFFKWVRGHAGNRWNEKVDVIAQNLAQREKRMAIVDSWKPRKVT